MEGIKRELKISLIARCDAPMEKLRDKLKNTRFAARWSADKHFQERVSQLFAITINCIYIAVKLYSGIYYRSAWFIALAIYYALLVFIRDAILGRVSVQDRRLGWRRYRLCGIMLLFMNQALTVLVVFIVHQNKSFEYSGYLIYAMALYAFYAIITAVIEVFRIRRYDSPVLSAAKAVNLVAAMVSILSLTTALLSRYGGESGVAFSRTITALTGGGICVLVLAMAIYMIVRATGKLRFENQGPRG